ncbi:hypothetical protein [Burkholderia multivorans]|uniref:hypothetical protein n=1 Tax=Burkholderia multivorans TaxID=87883 RepID=UPI001903C56E|nr:hypothetical protein [Burkholderia multivorans]MBJ9625739.1 hypothetical protein [Burkholderia multivorans]
MPVVKSFTQAQWDAAARRLDALPEKPAHEHRVNIRDAMKCLQSQVIAAQRKGCAQEEIVQQIAQDGVEISASTLRYAMRCVTKENRSERTERDAATNTGAVSSRAKKTGQARSLNIGNARAESQKKRDERITRSESAPIKGLLGFPISPDTENL